MEILGKGNNCTDLRVNLIELTDPSTQTRFENCVADVNIPLGEVFTSPKLSGTEGLLHVESVYVGEIQFKNLKMKFEDGRVTEVSGDNFLELLPTDANEEAVAKFLRDEIGFYDIYRLVRHAVDTVPFIQNPTLDQILESDRLARKCVNEGV